MNHRENRLRRHEIQSGREDYTGAIRFWEVNSRRPVEIRLLKRSAGYSAALHAVYYAALLLWASR